LCATLGVTPRHVGGVVFLRLNPAALAPFASLTAATMDTRYDLERFAILIHAARDFLARGNSSLDLTPFAAARSGVLDATIADYPLPSQAAGYPLVSVARTNIVFHAIVEYLISQGMIRERLAIQLGPRAPGNAASTSGIWLGPWTADSIAIGVLAGPQAAATLITRFGPQADAIYYPYPLPYSTRPSSAHEADDPQMLLIVQDRDAPCARRVDAAARLAAAVCDGAIAPLRGS